MSYGNERIHHRIVFELLVCLILTLGGKSWAGTVYVTTGGSGNGTSWGDAAALDNALVVAQEGDDLWLAQGTYAGTTFTVATNNLTLYGGFTNGMSFSDRDADLYPTLLDGEASRRVVNIPGENITLDGLSVQNGLAGDYGAGLAKTGSGALTMRGCRIASNKGDGGDVNGIGAYFGGGSVTLTNCSFVDNEAGLHRNYGYGFYASGADVVVSDCLFSNNVAGTSGRMTWGGGIYFENGALSVSGSSFLDNMTRTHDSIKYGGSAAYVGPGSTAGFTNCVFRGNQAVADNPDNATIAYGGALFLNPGTASTVTVENCTLFDNYARTDGGAIYVASGNLELKNCIVWSNSVSDGGGEEIYCTVGTAATVGFTCLTGTGSDDLFGSISRSNTFTNAPLFASATDVHLKSEHGRWDPALAIWPNDSVTSPCIDVGDPASDYAKEPTGADGARINLGAYGNTSEASKSPAVVAPEVTNLGATTEYNIATLSGKLTSGTLSDITIYWGTNISDLSDSETLYPPQSAGVVFEASEVLLPNQQYYFACYATNSAGENWSGTNGFTTGSTPPSGGEHIIHVDKDAPSPEDGLSWYTAYPTLAEGVAAVTDSRSEIWIAEGTYVQGSEISLSADMSIYGGFTGTETNCSARSLTNEVVLDGAGSYRVLSITGTKVLLDGLSITDGTVPSNSDGAGLAKTSAGSLVMRNCNVIANKGGGGDINGLGAYFAGGSVTLTNCQFRDNAAAGGGYRNYGYGFYASGADLIVQDCVFSNSTGGRMTWGGGFYFANGSLSVSGSSFINNNARGHTSTKYGGAGAYVGAGSTAGFTNCVFRGNESVADVFNATIAYGGALFLDPGEASTVTVENCTLFDNYARTDGGAIYVASGNLEVKNSIVWSNSVTDGAGDDLLATSAASAMTISYADLTGADSPYVEATGGASLSWGNGIISTNPLFASASDLHLKSKHGRWVPTQGVWTTDLVTSPCIDAGDKSSSFALEPEPNGERINLGAYGNTVYASKRVPPTNGTLIILR